ncbi:hypothetical protein G5I_03748 [Acromyrmex echinatior]|uniref:Uncharacterized protein n=1 Tax=Acromyrmex echinatior TaxID=103372 RepID=F4WDT2_ACREC|nr:hypothetical protein G5I_03748 [Acromyrmex echinatior]
MMLPFCTVFKFGSIYCVLKLCKFVTQFLTCFASTQYSSTWRCYSNIELADIHYMYGKVMEIAEKLNVYINKSSLKDDALLKIPSVRSIVDLEKQDLSYLIQLIEDEAELLKQLQSKSKYAIKCSLYMMKLQHSAALLESFWIIITSIDELVEENLLFGLHFSLHLNPLDFYSWGLKTLIPFHQDKEQPDTELFLQALPFYITLLVGMGIGGKRGVGGRRGGGIWLVFNNRENPRTLDGGNTESDSGLAKPVATHLKHEPIKEAFPIPCLYDFFHPYNMLLEF